jgi:hypothetical protein
MDLNIGLPIILEYIERGVFTANKMMMADSIHLTSNRSIYGAIQAGGWRGADQAILKKVKIIAVILNPTDRVERICCARLLG